ncbi:hypothetical protein H0H81_006292 [Sphagnurus paluster]|uniref:Gag-like protein n=1 Tax=Sphagnurus paluster TaxID=117069 RepID=A0A9P7FL89_9AGAR|nr:hypothetical protein H0H81_006292 [Sphagnurus paluster]
MFGTWWSSEPTSNQVPPPINNGIDNNLDFNDNDNNMQEDQQRINKYGLPVPQPPTNESNVFKQVLNMMSEMRQEMKASIQAINDKVEKATNLTAPAPKPRPPKPPIAPTNPASPSLTPHGPANVENKSKDIPDTDRRKLESLKASLDNPQLGTWDRDTRTLEYEALCRKYNIMSNTPIVLPASEVYTNAHFPNLISVQASHSTINSMRPAVEGLNAFQSVGKNGKPAKQKAKRTTKLDTAHSLRRWIISAMPGDKQRFANTATRPPPSRITAALNMALTETARGLFKDIHPGGPIQLVSWTKGNNIAVNMDDRINSESFIGLVETVSSTIESIPGMGEGAVRFRPWVKTVKFQLAHVPVWDWLADEALEAKAVGMFIKESTAFKGITLASEFRWIRKPETFTSSQNCGVSFSVEDADGKVTERLLATALSINGQRCRFEKWVNAIAPLQCTKCWRLGHHANNCTALKAICATCCEPTDNGKSHNHALLVPASPGGITPVFDRGCINCKNAKKTGVELEHHPASIECPFYKTARNKIVANDRKSNRMKSIN